MSPTLMKVGQKLFNLALVHTDFSQFQRELANAHSSRTPALCMCVAEGVSMVIYKREVFHIRRYPGTAKQHAISCRSHILLDDGATLADTLPALNYPRTLYVKKLMGLSPGRSASEPEEKRIEGAKQDSSLSDILDALWRQARLCRWKAPFKPWPWERVKIDLAAASHNLMLGKQKLATRLLIISNDVSINSLKDIEGSKTARRPLKIAIGTIRNVIQTKRDVCIITQESERIWLSASQCVADFEKANVIAKTVPGANVIAALAVYWDGNARCKDWIFIPVTKAWHLFGQAAQGELYQQLVSASRVFSIPGDKSAGAPWAVLFDAHGGPRAIVSKEVLQPNTFYPSWKWSPGSPLPYAQQTIS